MTINLTFEPADFALLKYAVRRAQFEEERESKRALSNLCRDGCAERSKLIAALVRSLDTIA